jgi:hypothetical protein
MRSVDQRVVQHSCGDELIGGYYANSLNFVPSLSQ